MGENKNPQTPRTGTEPYHHHSPPQGWQCPQCKRIYSPAVRECAACAPEATVGCTCLRFETDYRVFVQAMPDCPIHGQKKAE